MDATEPSPVELRRALDRQEAQRSITLVEQAIVLAVLLIATLVAPLTSVLRADSDDTADRAGSLFPSLGYFFSEQAETFGDRETHPNGLDAGLLSTRVGLVLLLIAVLGTLVAVAMLWSGERRARRPVLVALGIALILAGVLTFFGLTWLPDSEFVTTATAWLWLPIAAGAWVFFHLWSRHQLD